MKHADASTFARLAGLLETLRKNDSLVEKKPGIYYLKSKAFLHFHDDGDRIYADVRLKPPEFDRLPVTTERQQAALLEAIAKRLGQV